MADLTSIFGGAWSPPAPKPVASPEDQLRSAMLEIGITPPEKIFLDGALHRFRSNTKGEGGHTDKPGWYVVFGDGVPAGRFGCWRAGVEVSFKAEMGRELTQADEMAIARRTNEARTLRDADKKKSQEAAANTVDTIWTGCTGASPEHPYLARKGIKPNGARVTGDGRLVVPLYDEDGVLSTLQYIDNEGGKLYHPGGATGGKFNIIGNTEESGPLYVAEGFATAATIHEITGRPCVVAYSASNIVPVVATLHTLYPDMVIVADHDASGVGQKYAEQASAKYGARMVMPPTLGDANDYAQAGNDLNLLLNPPKIEWLVPADDFCAQPAPIKWFVKNWIQQEALIMVHGPSGGGKTFAVLDWCLRMGSGMDDWMGHKVKPAKIVYLAGEGHQGLRGRIAAWKHYNKASKLQMWLSKDGCDLNTIGGLKRVIDSIAALDIIPDVLVIDTLHRFLVGDENSSQDAKTMLDACAALMIKFKCSVILVHHTGNSDEAQHRARGSSAWKGALDIEISIVPAKGDTPMQIVQRKSKDAEMAAPLHASLKSVEIPGWFDEDGIQITSAVLVQEDAPAPTKKTGPLASNVKTFANAWWATAAEEREGKPYVSESGLKQYLIKDLNYSEKTAKQYTKPTAEGKLINTLLVGNMIAPHEYGWVIEDQDWANILRLDRNSR